METRQNGSTESSTSKETEKSVQTGNQVIDLNKKLAGEEGRDPEKEKKKDEQKWTSEG